jgi:hypothetical protein
MYSAFDKKNSRYFHTGRNSKYYRDCFEAIKSIMALHSMEDWENEPDRKLLDFFKVRIDKHKKVIEV